MNEVRFGIPGLYWGFLDEDGSNEQSSKLGQLRDQELPNAKEVVVNAAFHFHSISYANLTKKGCNHCSTFSVFSKNDRIIDNQNSRFELRSESFIQQNLAEERKFDIADKDRSVTKLEREF